MAWSISNPVGALKTVLERTGEVVAVPARVLSNGVDEVTRAAETARRSTTTRAQKAIEIAGEVAGKNVATIVDGAKKIIEVVRTPLPPPDAPKPSMPRKTSASDVFIIHGHDEAALAALKAAITGWGLKPISLQEQAAELRTIKEKFEAHAYSSTVGCAVALVTPDDDCTCQAQTGPHKRPRQNVIFELGFFASAFRGKRTCILMKGKPEMPSDLAGIDYIEMDDAGAWKASFEATLRAARMTIRKPRAKSKAGAQSA